MCHILETFLYLAIASIGFSSIAWMVSKLPPTQAAGLTLTDTFPTSSIGALNEEYARKLLNQTSMDPILMLLV